MLVQEWLGRQVEGSLLSSEWVGTEFAAALSIKIRTGQLQSAHRPAILDGFFRLMNESFLVLPVARAEFRTAARFAHQHTTGLRAGDALHLAIVEESGGVLVTLDHRLAAAAGALGVKAQRL
jgi:predicted nucleic acid-binding protein